MAYNILLFGETGAGKSTTTINALANYLRYASFDEAASAGELVNLVPSKFTYPETNGSQIVDQNGIDSDTNKSNDNSVGTPKHYELELGSDDNNKKQIRIIDTLGMGNLEIDKENFKVILEHLKGLETLHGICFLIDKNSVFKSNLNELLSQVPRSASKNILFCFTFNSSNSLLDGADSQFATLKTLLDENELGSSKIDLKIGENCFFIDNEAFGYLLTQNLSDNSAFTEDQSVHYRENWNASRDQALAMLQQIVSNNFEPIQLELLFKLINTQKWIQELANPIDELKTKIYDQKESIKEDQRKMNSFNNKSKKRNSNAKQIKTTNDRIKAKRQALREFEMELEIIEKFLRTCLRFVVLNANFNCKDLLLPYENC